MYLAQAFTILLFLSVSTQKVLKPEVFDDISNMTKKCQDAIKTHTEQVQACNIKLAQKWEDKLINDVNNTKTFEKDICDVIKDEENQCINIVKGLCSSEEIKLIDKTMVLTIKEAIKQQFGIDVNC